MQQSETPMSFFSDNVDKWGAAEWFDRLAKAIRAQDNAAMAEDDIAFETYRMIAASSAITLVRDHEATVRAALSASPLPSGTVGEPVGEDETEICPVCGESLKAEDMCATDIELGICHAACLDGTPTVYLDTGEPSEGPIDTYRYGDVSSSPPNEPAPQVVGDWRPIETAPKDGGDILCYGEYHGTPVRFVARWNLVQWYTGWGNAIQPAHWQPLPALPTDGKEEANV